MKIYRIDLRDESYVSLGYEFVASHAEAQRLSTELVNDPGSQVMDTEIERFEVPRRKAGLIRWLNLYAGHPNNG